MNDVERIRKILRDALQLGARADSLSGSSRLLGGIPEFDSMAVVSIIGMIEEEYGFVVDDDEMSADVFETLDSFATFVAAKAAR